MWCMGKGAWKTLIGGAYNRQICKCYIILLRNSVLKLFVGSADFVVEKPSRGERTGREILFYLVIGLIRPAGMNRLGKLGPS
jgi:hypothetical protein